MSKPPTRKPNSTKTVARSPGVTPAGSIALNEKHYAALSKAAQDLMDLDAADIDARGVDVLIAYWKAYPYYVAREIAQRARRGDEDFGHMGASDLIEAALARGGFTTEEICTVHAANGILSDLGAVLGEWFAGLRVPVFPGMARLLGAKLLTAPLLAAPELSSASTAATIQAGKDLEDRLSLRCEQSGTSLAARRQTLKRALDVLSVLLIKRRAKVPAAPPGDLRGATVRQAAGILYGDLDPETVPLAVAVWRKKRVPKPPSIGNRRTDRRAKLYDCDALADYVMQVADHIPMPQSTLAERLRFIAEAPAD